MDLEKNEIKEALQNFRKGGDYPVKVVQAVVALHL